jgi:hypothetical protein
MQNALVGCFQMALDGDERLPAMSTGYRQSEGRAIVAREIPELSIRIPLKNSSRKAFSSRNHDERLSFL